MSTRRFRLLADAGVVGAAALILVVTLDSNVPNNQAFVVADGSYYTLGVLPLVAHFTLFAVLGVAVALRQFVYRSRLTWQRAVVFLAVVAIFAAADEQAQRWVAGHGPETVDWVADLAGVITGLLIARRALLLFGGLRRQTDS